MEEELRQLKVRLADISDLHAANHLLSWDQSTYMPSGGAAARGRQRSTLARLAHERSMDPELGKLLEKLRPYEGSLAYDSDDASLIRVARRDFERAVKIPTSYVAEFSAHSSASYQAWTAARPANDFAAAEPFLEKTLELSRRYADFFPGYDHIADPLLESGDEGWKTAELREIFAELRRRLVPLASAIASRPPADDSCLRRSFPEAKQLTFGLEIVRQMGYDLERGRQDRSPHPFTTKFSLGDVRITTRVRENDLRDALFATVHEAGHGMYEQGIQREFEATPLARGTSSGVHESQSRLWENMVARSRGFWKHFYPRLQRTFPSQLRSIPLDTFYRAINRVQPSLIRVDADEVTYNLHVMLRFDLELEMLEGRLAVRDLPEAWRERFRSDLGVVPPDDRDGVLQDVHWYAGTIGGEFQGYTLGNLLAAQLFEAAVRAHPEIPAEIEAGRFGTLLGWLRERIHRHGRKYLAPDLIQRATGQPLSIEPLMRYLTKKYGELYGI